LELGVSGKRLGSIGVDAALSLGDSAPAAAAVPIERLHDTLCLLQLKHVG
jgi:hypothetical protein